MTDETVDAALLPANTQLTTMNADKSNELPNYDFMITAEVSTYLGIGLTQSYEICEKINAKLAEQG